MITGLLLRWWLLVYTMVTINLLRRYLVRVVRRHLLLRCRLLPVEAGLLLWQHLMVTMVTRLRLHAVLWMLLLLLLLVVHCRRWQRRRLIDRRRK